MFFQYPIFKSHTRLNSPLVVMTRLMILAGQDCRDSWHASWASAWTLTQCSAYTTILYGEKDETSAGYRHTWKDFIHANHAGMPGMDTDAQCIHTGYPHTHVCKAWDGHDVEYKYSTHLTFVSRTKRLTPTGPISSQQKVAGAGAITLERLAPADPASTQQIHVVARVLISYMTLKVNSTCVMIQEEDKDSKNNVHQKTISMSEKCT